MYSTTDAYAVNADIIDDAVGVWFAEQDYEPTAADLAECDAFLGEYTSEELGF